MRQILTNREIAVAAWAAAGFAFMLGKAGFRRAIKGLLRGIVAPKLLPLWAALLGYALALVLALRAIGVWQPQHIKLTVLWLFTAIAYLFQFNDITKPAHVARRVLRENISFLIILEFLIDSYPLPLPAELLLIPSVFLLGASVAYAEWKQIQPTARVLGWVQAVLGFGLAGAAIHSAVVSRDLTLMEASRQIAVPVLLSVGMIPFLLLYRVAMAGDDLRWRIGFDNRNEKPVSAWLQRYGAARILWHVRLDPVQANDFIRRNPFRLFSISNRQELQRMLALDAETVIDESTAE